MKYNFFFIVILLKLNAGSDAIKSISKIKYPDQKMIFTATQRGAHP